MYKNPRAENLRQSSSTERLSYIFFTLCPIFDYVHLISGVGWLLKLRLLWQDSAFFGLESLLQEQPSSDVCYWRNLIVSMLLHCSTIGIFDVENTAEKNNWAITIAVYK